MTVGYPSAQVINGSLVNIWNNGTVAYSQSPPGGTLSQVSAMMMFFVDVNVTVEGNQCAVTLAGGVLPTGGASPNGELLVTQVDEDLVNYFEDARDVPKLLTSMTDGGYGSDEEVVKVRKQDLDMLRKMIL